MTARARGLVLALALAAGCSHPLPDSCARKGPLKLVPLGVGQAVDLDTFAAQYAARHEVALTVATPVNAPAGSYDQQREQHAAEDLIAAIDAHRREGDETLIGVTASDLFIRGRPDWRWGFGTWNERGTGVISTYRMQGDARLVERRLAGMLGRYVGMLYCGLPREGPPHSTLREQPILSAADLDAIDPDRW